MRDLFNPQTGEFAKNIRTEEGDLAELRESMKTFGWVDEFPALADERGVVLVGHRRLAVAAELGISPVIKTLTLGTGDGADAKRFQLALVSNLGHQPMTPADRKRIAEYLYGEREWTMQRIAEAVGVSQRQISSDLAGLEVASKPPRPKGGRPREAKVARRLNTTPTAEVAARKILDEGQTYGAVEKQTGFSSTVLRSAVAREEGRREATPQPADQLSATAQQKLDAAIQRATQRLEVEIEERIHQRLLETWVGPLVKKQAEERDHFERVLKARRGVMTRADYRKILACLHPDRVVSDPTLHAKYQEAFILFTKMEKCLLDEKESPTAPSTLPRTLEELLAQKKRFDAERREKRQQRQAS